MDYSLLSKFRGAWLGSFLAAQIKKQTLLPNQPDELSSAISENPLIDLAENKLLDLAKRQWRSLNIHWKDSARTEPPSPKLSQAPAKAHDLALFILPVILFYHDYWSYLAIFLRSQGEEHQLLPIHIDCLLVWAYAIRLGLRGELSSPNLTAKILKETNISDHATSQWLSTIVESSQQGDSSQKLFKNHLDKGDVIIGLSLFYFLNNRGNFQLSTQQGFELADLQQIKLAALGGALSGSHNGLSTISSSWRNSHQKKNYYQYLISKTEDIMRGWSGSDFTNETNSSLSIVTSTGILQPRHNLKIISQ